MPTSQDNAETIDQLIALRRYVHAHCYRFLKNDEEAKDAAQEVLVRAIQNLRTFCGTGSLKAWVCRIATNYCLNYLRDQRTVSYDAENTRNLVDEVEQSPSAAQQAEISLLHSQLLDEIKEKAKTRKPPWDEDDYFIFQLYYKGENRTWAEIAAILDKPVDTVKYRYYNRIKPTLNEIKETFDGHG